MSRHATAEELSSYLDQELEPVRLRLVKSHLAECDDCRRKVEGLRGLVGELQLLERIQLPPALDLYLERRIVLEPRRRDWLESAEGRLRGLVLQPSLGFTFALVIALASILYLFADWSDLRLRRSVLILRPPLPISEAPVAGDLGGRSFEKFDDQWWESGLDPQISPETIAIEVLAAESEEGARLRLSLPGLEGLLAEGPVVLRSEGRVVRLLPRSTAPSSGSH